MINTIKIGLVTIASMALVASCNPKKQIGKETITDQTPVEKEVTPITMMEEMAFPVQKDAFKIDTMRIVADTLEIDVSYSGCGEHDWTLFGNRYYRKTLPPQLSLSLWHDAHGDLCKKLFKRTLYFNIRKVRYPGKDSDYTIFLDVNGSSLKIPYRY